MEETHYCTFLGCQRVYSSEVSLRRHVKAVHTEETKFQCAYCRKALSSRQNLIDHIYLHTGEAPYACNEPGCELSFRKRSQLTDHRRSHLPRTNDGSVVDIRPLNVIVRQLARLLEMQPVLAPEEEDHSHIAILLPPIVNSQAFDKINSKLT